MAQSGAAPPLTVPYGPHPKQFVRVHLARIASSDKHSARSGGGGQAAGAAAAAPVVLWFHGGFWKAKWDIDATRADLLAADLAHRGITCITAEYRDREDGGGWRGSFEDALAVLALVQQLGETSLPLDLRRVILLGHSAGGTLAIWAGHHHNLSHRNHATGRGKSPVFQVLRVYAVNAVTDMAAAYEEKLSDEGDAAFLCMQRTTPQNNPQAYREASPLHLPEKGSGLAVHVVLVAARDDADVPFSHSQRMARDWPAQCCLMPYTGGHYAAVDVATPQYQAMVAALVKDLTTLPACWFLFPLLPPALTRRVQHLFSFPSTTRLLSSVRRSPLLPAGMLIGCVAMLSHLLRRSNRPSSQQIST